MMEQNLRLRQPEIIGCMKVLILMMYSCEENKFSPSSNSAETVPDWER